jgi:hypothetical protein
LDQAEQDIRIIQTEVSIICFSETEVSVNIYRSKAEADNADRGLNNSDILRKPNSNFSFIIHSVTKTIKLKPKRAEAAEAIVKTK